MPYFAYILYSKSLNRFYFGSCKDVEIRIVKHLAKHSGFTGKTKDWRLVLVEEYSEKSIAIKKERQWKNWKSSERIWRLIERCHRDLYEYCGAGLEPMD